MLTRVVRDAEFHAGVREIQKLRAVRSRPRRTPRWPRCFRAGPVAAARCSVVALDFRTWKGRAGEGGLSQEAAVESMVAAIMAQ